MADKEEQDFENSKAELARFTEQMRRAKLIPRFESSIFREVDDHFRRLQELHLDHNIADALYGTVDIRRLKDDAIDEVGSFLSLLEGNEKVLSGKLQLSLALYLHDVVGSAIESIEAAAPLRHVPDPNGAFAAERLAVISVVQSKLEARKKSIYEQRLGAYALLRTLRIDGSNSLVAALSDVQTQLDMLQTSTDQRMKDLDLLERSIRDAMSKYSVARMTVQYADQAKDHAEAESWWISATIIAAAIAACAVGYIFQHPIPDPIHGAAAISLLVRHAILLTVVTTLVRFTLKRWNLERDLQLKYRHRVSTIDQFMTLEKMILDSEDGARDRLRTALAKYLFSDPATGYGEPSASDFNLSPLFQFGESVAKRASPKE